MNDDSKLARREYKTRHDWVGKVIDCKLCKKMKFNHTIKWYMRKQESILENEMHKIFLDFDIQTDPLISARRPDQGLTKKKKSISRIVNFAVPADHTVKNKESEKRDKYLPENLESSGT